MRRRSLIIVMLAIGWAGAGPAQAAEDSVFVYTGNSPIYEGYSSFAAAAGRALEVGATLPEGLGSYPCVVLPANSSALASDTKAALGAYVTEGGTLVALGEHAGFTGAIATMNDLASTIGSSMSIIASTIDGGLHTTTSVDTDVLTSGVSSIGYAATSEVSPGSGRSLVRTITDAETFIAAEAIGAGILVLSGDTNAFSDNPGDAYMNTDNGTLVFNMCGNVPTTLEANPAILTAGVPPTIYFPEFSATLRASDSGGPLEGMTIEFSAGGTLVCSGETDANGLASCGGVLEEVEAVLAGGYTASFTGLGSFEPSSDDGALIG